ncbi:MAG: xanthine dehydrogenase family protein molybdopterin-binding subunit [Dehalococcoidia bacterium]|nr:xanthine dehydrogenase family protein molybdopterin-binding subunit [Dehalococcoidia bacterium]
MPDYTPNMVLTSDKEYKVVGTRPVRHDGADKVTGIARYSADLNLPGMLYGKVLRSPHAHARIRSIDTSKAEAMPGVRAVITGADIVEPTGRASDLAEGAMINFKFLSNNIMAQDKALYKGHALAAVAAINPHVAEEALALIDVDYEVLPPVMRAQDAMSEGATLVHDRLAALNSAATRAGGILDDDDGSTGTNIANRFEFRMGDLDAGFREADIVVERSVSTSAVHQGYIEPHSGTAMWHQDGSLTIWSSSQGHFTVREHTARLVGVPVSKVKAIPMEIGGGFGAKLAVYMEPLAALLAKKAHAPVKVAMNRTEVFEATGPTSGTEIACKIGATNDGKITAAEVHLIFEAGAFPGSPVAGAANCVLAAYDIANTYIEGYDIVVNRPKTAAYRAPGSPAAAYCVEVALDELAEKLGIDPIDLRVINSAKEGTRRPTGPLTPKVGYVETLEATKSHPHYAAPKNGKRVGRGVASGFWGNNTGPAAAVALVNPDGTVTLTEGSPDIGGTRASVSQQFAEVLGIAAEDVHPQIGDTDSIGFTSNTGGSSVTFKTGFAAYTAAQDVKQQMIARAARIWEVEPEDVLYEDGALKHRSDDQLQMTFQQLAARQVPTGGPIVGRGGVNPGGAGPCIGVHIVDVEVDEDTGKVDVVRYTAIQDAGKAIHPSYVEGQIQGGAVQGIGWALNEEYYISDQGHMLNSSFLDYRMPTSLDLPMIDTCIVEVDNPNHPYGVRGVGEVPIVPPMAAIANAIYDAIGVRLTVLPMNPGNVLEALWEKNGN